jgi:hypothetical protein
MRAGYTLVSASFGVALLSTMTTSFSPSTGFLAKSSSQNECRTYYASMNWGLKLNRRVLLKSTAPAADVGDNVTSAQDQNSSTVKDADSKHQEEEEIKTELLKSTSVVSDVGESFEISQDQSSVQAKAANSKQGEEEEEEERFAMPWSDIQDWALRDNIAKYTIMIPLTRGGKETAEVYALWRTMTNELTEVAGYPIDFLQDMHSRQRKKGESPMQVTPALLPYLDEYDFTSAGGMSGRVYGIPGLADGTTIETSAVDNVQLTLVKGFIRTSDGAAAYELGRPQREEFTSFNAAKKGASGALLGNLKNAGSQVVPLAREAADSVEDADQMLVRLGASTGILLAGATALNMLSHHMTFNVFWV